MDPSILYTIAEFIEPNPETFYRLATVSRAFYSVFSSDTVWARLNPYDAAVNIKESFWYACNQDPREAKITAMYYRDGIKLPPTDPNLFSWLGAMRVEENARYFSYFEELPVFLECLFSINGMAMAGATPAIQQSVPLARIAIKQSPCVLTWLPYSMQCNRELVMIYLTSYTHDTPGEPPFAFIGEHLYDDKEIMTLASSIDPSYFSQASLRLKNDREFVRSLVATNGKVLIYTYFMGDRELALMAIKNCWEVFAYSRIFCDDPEIVLAAVSQPGSLALLTATPRLQQDRRIVLAAARAGAWFKRLHPVLSDDEEIALGITDTYTSESFLPAFETTWMSSSRQSASTTMPSATQATPFRTTFTSS